MTEFCDLGRFFDILYCIAKPICVNHKHHHRINTQRFPLSFVMSAPTKDSPPRSAGSSSSTLYRTPRLKEEETYKFSYPQRSPVRSSGVYPGCSTIPKAFNHSQRLWEAFQQISDRRPKEPLSVLAATVFDQFPAFTGFLEGTAQPKGDVSSDMKSGRLLDYIDVLNGLFLCPSECNDIGNIEQDLNVNEFTISNYLALVETIYSLLNKIRKYNQSVRLYQTKKNILIGMMLEELTCDASPVEDFKNCKLGEEAASPDSSEFSDG